MKEKFTKEQHQKFINYFNIKKEASKIENNFYKKTQKYIKFIKWIPGLKMIGIGNSISMNCSKSESDIDLLIVTSNNSMWLNRILITLIFQLLGVRKTPKKHAGMFCLSFFSTIDGLNFNSWKLENDIYLYFWILYFKPILNFDNTYELFLKENSWADFDEYQYIIEDNKKYIKYSGKGKYYNNNNNNNNKLTFLNSIFKNIFIKKTIKHFENIGKPYGVIINDNLLKFHNNDIRNKIKEDLVKN